MNNGKEPLSLEILLFDVFIAGSKIDVKIKKKGGNIRSLKISKLIYDYVERISTWRA